MITQLSVSQLQEGRAGVTTVLDLSEDTEVGEQEKITTAAVFLGCVSASAKADSRLTKEQSQSMQIEPTSRAEEVVYCTDIGNRVVLFGEKCERIRSKLTAEKEFRDFVDNAVSMSDSDGGICPFQAFASIADLVLDIGIASHARIATLFLLGYELCAAFIRRHRASLFMNFIERLLNYLIRYLKDIGFFDWLVRHSWGHLTPDTAVYAIGVGTGMAVGLMVVGVLAAVGWLARRI